MVSPNYLIDPAYDMVPAFAGMKADSMVGNTESLAAAASISFGRVVGRNNAGQAVLPVGTTPAGVALHDHTKVGRMLGSPIGAPTTGYIAGDAVSVYNKGRVWGEAGGVCTQDAPAKYDPATGIFSDAGTATLPRAIFRTIDYTWPGVLLSDPTQRVVLVELDYPLA